MKKLLLSLSLLLTATAANAISDNAKFVAIDSSFETTLCVTAATKGFKAAYQEAEKVSKEYAKSLYLNTCNGVAIKQFALPKNTDVKTKLVKVVAGDQTAETKLCVEAATKGYDSVVAEQNISSLRGIVCNGKSIQHFAKGI